MAIDCVSLVVFGSVARRSARPDSDLDFLVIADRLPDGRMARVAESEPVERQLWDLKPDFRPGDVVEM